MSFYKTFLPLRKNFKMLVMKILPEPSVGVKTKFKALLIMTLDSKIEFAE
jgi:hypothetical protein